MIDLAEHKGRMERASFRDTDEVHRLWRMFRELNRTVEELIMATGDMAGEEQALASDVGAVEQDEASLRTTVQSAVADIQTEVENLRGQVGDPSVLAALDQRVQALHAAVTTDTSSVAAADPGAQPTPPTPPAPPAPPAGT